jgi:hypothetical protein
VLYKDSQDLDLAKGVLYKDSATLVAKQLAGEQADVELVEVVVSLEDIYRS